MATNAQAPKPMAQIRHIPECAYVPMSIVQDTPFVDGYTDEELVNRRISVYSHMVHNRNNGDLAKEHWYLNHTVSLWNVAVEVGTLISGPDAETLADMLTTQDLTKCSAGQGKYTPILNNRGGLINDPVMYRLGAQEFLFTSSDSDMQRIAEDFLDGLVTAGMALDVQVSMPDIAMVQIQGPNAVDVMRDLLDDDSFMTADNYIPYYWFTECEKNEVGQWVQTAGAKIRRSMTCHDGTVVEISTPRTGFSRLPGFECIVYNASKVGKSFWETTVAAVRAHGGDQIGPGHTQRIPGGILSFGNDITRDGLTNPFEVYVDHTQLNRIIPISKKGWYRGKEAIEQLRETGPSRKLVGIRIMGESVGWYNDGSMSRLWHVYDRHDVHWLPESTHRQADGTIRTPAGDVYDANDAVEVEFGRPEFLGRFYILPEGTQKLGDVTSACWSPQHEINIARGFVPIDQSREGTNLTVMTEWGLRDAIVIPMPYTPENVDIK
ncbi:MAG TPA: glycine cleavage T C-terminal barrel domain-containing protein [Candidatus Saccharimonadales bacterium]|nr:glycine cleavage T C-terminal barrel domain-containing protein [Candidatus Saccharimonadales bacterium]